MTGSNPTQAPRGTYFTAPEGTTVKWTGATHTGALAVIPLNNSVPWSGLNDPAGVMSYRERYHGGLTFQPGERRADGCDVETYSAWQFHLIDHGPAGDLTATKGWPHPADVHDWAAFKFDPPRFGIPIAKAPKPPVQPPAQPPPPPISPPVGKALSPIPQRVEELRVIALALVPGVKLFAPKVGGIFMALLDENQWEMTKMVLGPTLEMWRAIKSKAERP